MTEQRENLIRRYAAGDISWHDLRANGFEDYIEVLGSINLRNFRYSTLRIIFCPQTSQAGLRAMFVFWIFRTCMVIYFEYIGGNSGQASQEGSQSDETRIAFLNGCMKSFNMKAPFSSWLLPNRVEYCNCTAAKSIGLIGSDELQGFSGPRIF